MRPVTATDTLPQDPRFTYDANGRVTSVTDPALAPSLLRYNAAGDLEAFELPTGEIQTRDYDARDRLESLEDPITGLTTWSYDGNGNLKTRTDAKGATTSFTYDAADQLTQVTDALTNSQLYGYDANGNLTSLTDERGEVTGFTYDALDRRDSRSNPLLGTATFGYDTRDNLVTFTDPKSQTITRLYDGLNRLTDVMTPDNSIQLAYDAAGNLTAASDDDSDLTFTYDALHRLETAVTGPLGLQPPVTLTSAYNVLSERQTLTDSLGGAWTSGFDPVSRLAMVTAPRRGHSRPGLRRGRAADGGDPLQRHRHRGQLRPERPPGEPGPRAPGGADQGLCLWLRCPGQRHPDRRGRRGHGARLQLRRPGAPDGGHHHDRGTSYLIACKLLTLMRFVSASCPFEGRMMGR